jgi:TatD DNase family protein
LNLVDTHCHLNLDAFQDDLQAVLDRASEQGIQRILVPGIDIETSRTAIALAEQHSNIFAAVGVHPNDALSWNHESYEILKELAEHSKVVAVGEIGLDYYRDHAPRSLQQDILQQQLRLASECSLPVVLHNRAALHDLCPAIYAWQNALEQNGSPLAKRPGVLHSYDGDLETALRQPVSIFLSVSAVQLLSAMPQTASRLWQVFQSKRWCWKRTRHSLRLTRGAAGAMNLLM